MGSRLRAILACGVAACALVSCFPQGACSSNPGFVEYCGPGDTSCQGVILDATHWQSGPISSDWLDFSRERTIRMHFRDAKGASLSGTLGSVEAFISVTKSLTQSPNQFVPCSGNNCEITPIDDGTVDVRNDTCGDYFVYVTVTVFPNTDASVDASTE